MKTIIDRIAEEKARLATGKLFRWLSDESVPGAQRLNFAPSMLYYLMGFKDVLEALYRPDPQGDLDHAINAYCGEDAEHWRWYLEDLEKLGFHLETWGGSIRAWCNEVWSPATRPNRQTIFRLVRHATACDDPLYAMSLILVFEATGVVFIGHTRKAAVALGMDDELKYFGRIHYEEEFGHSVQARELLVHELDEGLRPRILVMVTELFADYRQLFDCWYEHRDEFSPRTPGDQRTLRARDWAQGRSR